MRSAVFVKFPTALVVKEVAEGTQDIMVSKSFYMGFENTSALKSSLSQDSCSIPQAVCPGQMSSPCLPR